MAPQIPARDPYGVLLLGEALGEREAELGQPFVGKAGFTLNRMIEWAGLDRDRFHITNSVYCRPPNNQLEGQPFEFTAISHCRTHHWGRLLDQVSVVVPLGNVPTGALLGRKGITSLRGYVYGGRGYHVLPTFHPSFIQRGNAKHTPAVINDLQKAVELARVGLPPQPVEYLLDPTPRAAYVWAMDVVSRLRGMGQGDGMAPRGMESSLLRGQLPCISFDIETPYKSGDEGVVNDDDDPTYTILRIGFSGAGHTGMSIPWGAEYIPAIKLLLDNDLPKVVWNANFDVPRIIANGVRIGGIIHDGMIAWHILHSDLPKGLGFVATFTCPYQSEWKSLSGSRPAYYNCCDADIEHRSFDWIRRELITVGMWEVYERDVLRINPILVHMSEKGVPVDQEVRLDRAVKLAHRQVELADLIDGAIPAEIRRVDPPSGFVTDPVVTDGLVQIQVQAEVGRCGVCGAEWPTKPHFRTFKRPTTKKPQNPCAGGELVLGIETVTRYARPIKFKPSREGLIRYHQALGRPIPTRRDRKTKEVKAVFDEMALKRLIKKYPKDGLYQLVMDFREVQKLASVYVGCVVGINA